MSDFSIRESLSRSNNILMLAVMEEMDTDQALKASKVSAAADMATEQPSSGMYALAEEGEEEEPKTNEEVVDPYMASPATPKNFSSAVDPVLTLLRAVELKMPLRLHIHHKCFKFS